MNFDLKALEQALNEEFNQKAGDEKSGGLDLAQYRSQVAFSRLELAAFPDFKIHVFETVSSTNTVVWELLQQGNGAGTVVIALTQQAGRGQRGHQWSSTRGGLYLSLGLTPNLLLEQAGVLTLSSAWGIAIALRAWGIPIQIKWLNDLVFAGRKLGGILTETRTAKGYIHQAVIGVGINFSNAVPAGGVNLQTIQAELQRQPIASLEILAAIVLQGLRLGYGYWQQHGIERLVAAYETVLVNLGDAVTIARDPKETVGETSGETAGKGTGTIVGITPTGRLRVQLDSPDRTEICLEVGAIHLGYGA